MRNPSPRDLRTRPPNAATWCCTIAACNARMSSASWSPRARRSSVEPTTSVIMIVSAFAARLRSGKDCLPCCYSAADLPFKLRRRGVATLHTVTGPGIKLIKESLQATLGLRIGAVVVLIDDLLEDRLIRIGMREEGHRGAQLDRVNAAEDVLCGESAVRGDDLGALDQPWPSTGCAR